MDKMARNAFASTRAMCAGLVLERYRVAMTRMALLLAAALAAVALQSSAAAQYEQPVGGPYERNDTAKQAKGPLKSGVGYKAAIETLAAPTNTLVDDEDWFYLQARKSTKLRVTISTTAAGAGEQCFGPVLTALNAKRKEVRSTDPARGKPTVLAFKAKRGRTYLRVAPYIITRCGVPQVYSLKIKRADQVVAGGKRFLKP